MHYDHSARLQTPGEIAMRLRALFIASVMMVAAVGAAAAQQ